MRQIVILCLSVSAGLLSPRVAGADAVTQWNTNAGKAALAACIAPIGNPLHESRMYAMMHVAIHDALNAIERRSRPYVFDVSVDSWASRDASVAAAARNVLVPLIKQIPAPPACLEAAVAGVEADYAAAIATIRDGGAKTLGIRVGRAAAAAIVALRARDGSDTPLQDFNYPQGTEPGEYRFTPGFNFVLAQLGRCRPVRAEAQLAVSAEPAVPPAQQEIH
jgi:hypothetical protein